MKKVLFYIIFMFITLVGIPLVVAFFGPKPESGLKSGDIMITVLKTESNKIEEVPLEEYLKGVVAGEMPASFHTEALKAQAVAARTYILNKMVKPDPDSPHPKAIVCDDSTHCKAWMSDELITEKFGESWHTEYEPKILAAIEATKGEIMVYNGEPIVAVFHSTSSGRTENSADVWGGDYPYLKSVESPGDSESPKYATEVTVDRQTFTNTLGVEPKIGEYTRSEGGSVMSLDIGGKLFRGADLRSMFRLNSADFTIEETADSFIFHVLGSGHGVGMSQYGANYLAKNGKSYQDILKAYYTGVEIKKDVITKNLK